MTSFGHQILLSISLSPYTLRPSLRKDGPIGIERKTYTQQNVGPRVSMPDSHPPRALFSPRVPLRKSTSTPVELPLPQPYLGRPFVGRQLWDSNPRPSSATSSIDDVIMTSFGHHILLRVSTSPYPPRLSLRKDGVRV
jgi:hypothetical protein